MRIPWTPSSYPTQKCLFGKNSDNVNENSQIPNLEYDDVMNDDNGK
jgi:hypothetical protein